MTHGDRFNSTIASSYKLLLVQPKSKIDCSEAQSVTQTFRSGFIWGISRHQSAGGKKSPWTSLSHGTFRYSREKADLKLANDVTGWERWWGLTAVKITLIRYEITQLSRLLAASSSDWVWANKSHTALGQIMAGRHDSMLQSCLHWFFKRFWMGHDAAKCKTPSHRFILQQVRLRQHEKQDARGSSKYWRTWERHLIWRVHLSHDLDFP